MKYKTLLLITIFSCFMAEKNAQGGAMLASSMVQGVKDLFSDRKKDIQSAVTKKVQDHHVYKWLKSKPFYALNMAKAKVSYLRIKQREKSIDKKIASLEDKHSKTQSQNKKDHINDQLELARAEKDKIRATKESREDDVSISKSRLQSSLQEEKTRQLGMKFDDIKNKLKLNKGPDDAFGPSNRFYNAYKRLLADAKYQYKKTIQILEASLKKAVGNDKMVIQQRLETYKTKQKEIEEEWIEKGYGKSSAQPQ